MLELWEPLGPGSPVAIHIEPGLFLAAWRRLCSFLVGTALSTSNEPGTVGYFFRASSKAPSRRACRIHPLLLVVVGGGSELDCLLATSGPAELIGMSKQVQEVAR